MAQKIGNLMLKEEKFSYLGGKIFTPNFLKEERFSCLIFKRGNIFTPQKTGYFKNRNENNGGFRADFAGKCRKKPDP